jgi:hypothetical protein
VSQLCAEVPDVAVEPVTLSLSVSPGNPALSDDQLFSDPRNTSHHTTPRHVAGSSAPLVTALSVEFVAVPRQTAQLQSTIPADIEAVFHAVEGYAGCMVLVSDHEARLITVITLWQGDTRSQKCSDNARWVKKLLTPHVDRWLRTQTQSTSLKGIQVLPFAQSVENFE